MKSKQDMLVILTPGFPENESDSTCIPPMQMFVKALKEICPQLNIVVLSFQYPFFSGGYRWHGVKVISFGGKNKGRIFRLFTFLRVWMKLKRLNEEYHLIGLLSFWLGKCAFTGDRFAKRYNLLHYSWLLGQDAKADNKYFNRISPKGESLIALSDFIAREVNKNYGVLPKHIVPVGINTGLFPSVSFKKDIDILGAGSLIPLKQYHVFLEIINLIRVSHPDVKAVICGDGPEMGRLQAMIASMDLEKNVSMAGRLTHHDVLVYMKRAKILLHTSEYEGFGAVCLEALYAGARVVSFVRPMNADIRNWHIAADKGRMLQLLKQLLQQAGGDDYTPVLPYAAQDIAGMVIKLFDYSEPAMS